MAKPSLILIPTTGEFQSYDWRQRQCNIATLAIQQLQCNRAIQQLQCNIATLAMQQQSAAMQAAELVWAELGDSSASGADSSAGNASSDEPVASDEAVAASNEAASIEAVEANICRGWRKHGALMRLGGEGSNCCHVVYNLVVIGG